LGASPRESGLECVVTYVRVDNPSFMRFFLRLSFALVAMRVERWRLFRGRVEFRPLEPSIAEQLIEAHDLDALTAVRLRSARA
jgi:hypothetical protein